MYRKVLSYWRLANEKRKVTVPSKDTNKDKNKDKNKGENKDKNVIKDSKKQKIS
ncbi:hypothetical protein D3C74_501450 [compost metagenome]